MSYRRPAAVALGAICLPLVLAAPAAASSSTNEVLYASDQSGVNELFLRDLGARTTTQVPLPVDDDPTDAQLSPDDTRVAYARSFFDPGLSLVGRSAGVPLRLTEPPQDDDTLVFDTDPTWLPDASEVVFTRYSVNFTADEFFSSLWRVPAAGGQEIEIPGTRDATSPDVSPTNRLVFDQYDEAGTARIVTSDLAGGTQVLTGLEGTEPVWSPDGSRLAYVGPFDDAGSRLMLTSGPITTTATAAPLTKSRTSSVGSEAFSPSWLPDGQSLVFEAYAFDAGVEEVQADVWAVDARDTRSGRVFGSPDAEETGPFAHGPLPGSVTPGEASLFRPIAPRRVLDTRPDVNVGARPGVLGATGTLTLPVRGTLPTGDGGTVEVPDDATAVVLNVTAIGGSQSTDIRVYPSGTPVPGASSLNAIRGLAVPNLVTARIGGDGAVVLRNGAGTVHLAADIAGYYVPAASGGSGFEAVDPARVFDSRPAPDNVGTSVGRIGAGATRDLQVVGSLPTGDDGTVVVPPTATAVVLNVTVTAPTASTDVRIYPTPESGTDFPVVSNLNAVRGLTAANLVTVAVGEGGKVRIRNNSGEAHVIADLAGYYTSEGGDQFVPVAPTRFLDTRDGTGAAPVPSGAGAVLDLKLTGSRGLPATTSGAVLNITVTGVSAGTDVRAYPTPALGGAFPTVSNLNVPVGVTRANLAVVRPGADGRVRLRNNSGSLALIGDVAGYFVPEPTVS